MININFRENKTLIFLLVGLIVLGYYLLQPEWYWPVIWIASMLLGIHLSEQFTPVSDDHIKKVAAEEVERILREKGL